MEIKDFMSALANISNSVPDVILNPVGADAKKSIVQEEQGPRPTVTTYNVNIAAEILDAIKKLIKQDINPEDYSSVSELDSEIDAALEQVLEHPDLQKLLLKYQSADDKATTVSSLNNKANNKRTINKLTKLKLIVKNLVLEKINLNRKTDTITYEQAEKIYMKKAAGAAMSANFFVVPFFGK